MNNRTQEPLIHIENLTKTYKQIGSQDQELEILRDVNLKIPHGQRVAIIGPSGSGKTTLLSILGGIDTQTSGSVTINGQEISNQDWSLRSQTVGIVFQNFELVPSFTALENVMLPHNIVGNRGIEQSKQALQDVGLGKRIHHLPSELSGGEKQRVAVARALANKPQVLLCDEPTGNLDQETGSQVLELILSQAQETDATVVIITHDLEVAQKMDSIYRLTQGTLVKHDNE